MPYTVAEAAEVIGKSKAAVFRAIRKGTLSATRDEFERHVPDRPGRAAARVSARACRVGRHEFRHGDRHVAKSTDLEGRLADAHETIRDLRRRLDWRTRSGGRRSPRCGF